MFYRSAFLRLLCPDRLIETSKRQVWGRAWDGSSHQLPSKAGQCVLTLLGFDNIRGCSNTFKHWAHIIYWIRAQSFKCCCWCHSGFFHGDKYILWEWLQPTKRTVNWRRGEANKGQSGLWKNLLLPLLCWLSLVMNGSTQKGWTQVQWWLAIKLPVILCKAIISILPVLRTIITVHNT